MRGGIFRCAPTVARKRTDKDSVPLPLDCADEKRYNKISKYDSWGVPTVTSAHRIGILAYRRRNGTGHYIAVQYCTNDDGTFKEYKAYNLWMITLLIPASLSVVGFYQKIQSRIFNYDLKGAFV